MNRKAVEGLLYQALETEKGGLEIYRTALEAACNRELEAEWKKYRAQTQEHHDKLIVVFEELGLDPNVDTPARGVIRHKARALVEAMKMAMRDLSPEEAELVAGECVVEAESKDHLNWTLLSHVMDEGSKEVARVLRKSSPDVLEEEARHFLHTHGWIRELWLHQLGFDAALPPPEEERSVKTLIGAGRAEHARKQYID